MKKRNGLYDYKLQCINSLQIYIQAEFQLLIKNIYLIEITILI